MEDRRHDERRKNVDWVVSRKTSGPDAGTYSHDAAQLAVLMDIRAEVIAIAEAMRRGQPEKGRKK